MPLFHYSGSRLPVALYLCVALGLVRLALHFSVEPTHAQLVFYLSRCRLYLIGSFKHWIRPLPLQLWGVGTRSYGDGPFRGFGGYLYVRGAHFLAVIAEVTCFLRDPNARSASLPTRPWLMSICKYVLHFDPLSPA
jgi:hypothetical protein